MNIDKSLIKAKFSHGGILFKFKTGDGASLLKTELRNGSNVFKVEASYDGWGLEEVNNNDARNLLHTKFVNAKSLMNIRSGNGSSLTDPKNTCF